MNAVFPSGGFPCLHQNRVVCNQSLAPAGCEGLARVSCLWYLRRFAPGGGRGRLFPPRATVATGSVLSHRCSGHRCSPRQGQGKVVAKATGEAGGCVPGVGRVCPCVCPGVGGRGGGISPGSHYGPAPNVCSVCRISISCHLDVQA